MPDLAVAIVHYHLRGGGVTRVINLALSALRRAGCLRAVVITGESPPEGVLPQGTAVAVVPGLGYTGGSASTTDRTREAAVAALGRKPDVWHLHNHSLGKNLGMPTLARDLAASGDGLILQIHDFAEDWRPACYRLLRQGCGSDTGVGPLLYPVAGNVRYVVLNRRDRELLVASGAPVELVRVLPNAVREPRTLSAVEAAAVRKRVSGEARRLVLYPVRPIRRKNLGELLLHALFAGPGTLYAVTLEPKNPAEQRVYTQWRRFSQSLDLPVAFKVSRQASLDELIAASDAIITTSVCEGFGLAFMEPWLGRRPVLGRDLPEITTDFAAAGVDLGGLYSGLRVPVDWVGTHELESRVEEALRRAYEAYGLEEAARDARRALDAMVHDGTVDYGSLDEGLQREVLERLHRDGPSRQRMEAVLQGSLVPAPLDLIERNRRTILDRYGEDRYGPALLELYQECAGSRPSVSGHVDGRALVRGYLRPERLRLLRT